ncbi:MAG: nitronate monooxygenase family protein [Alphaproteobacteria bacterium]|jgi:nitronate monooxygenase|nr:nitronate monooxygenase family protein [Alphaproteobacteria bacterium]
MWPRTDLIELLGISHPIVQAPMAGGPTTPALAAAVSNAGGLGSLGCAGLSLERLREQGEATRTATNRPFNLNFFCHQEVAAPADDAAAMRELLSGYYNELSLPEQPALISPMPAFDEAMLEVVLEVKPGVVSFHYGLPEAAMVERLKAADILLLCSATTVAEAKSLQAAGIDAVVAQGYEAGGHRGTFAEPYEAGEIGTFALVPQIADAVSLPVIAAGGVADGRGIAAAFALGASGVQPGTAFLSCPEAGTHPLYREALATARDDSTRLTRAFSGRPARALRNRFVDELALHQGAAAPFPQQRALTGPLAAKAQAEGSSDFSTLWSGQAVALNRGLPAAELIEVMVSEAQAILSP